MVIQRVPLNGATYQSIHSNTPGTSSIFISIVYLRGYVTTPGHHYPSARLEWTS